MRLSIRLSCSSLASLDFLDQRLRGYGCSGVSSVAYGLIAREFERNECAIESRDPIEIFGTEEQRERFLAHLARGKIIGCFGLTEPNHGSDPGSMETVARPHPTKEGVYLLSLAKTWITNSPIADVLLVWAKLDGLIKQFKSNPLAKYQLIQKKLAGALIDISYGLVACVQVGRLKDAGKAAPEMIGMIKRHNCDRALENSRKLMEIFGGNAASDEYHISRIAANLFVVQTYEGQSDIHALAPGRAITGVNAVY
ncbi:glutaryl dehydrogenase [Lipomyces starkeyi]